uniref:Rho GTPase-activating protein SYDE1 n=1 Tax=Jaculus jaculus TaxID=51337 RepID=A0A8C5K7G7_JACJA
MAEPLLRKTFSRLRGREKLARKKSDAKERAPHPAWGLEGGGNPLPTPPEPEPQALQVSQAGAEGPPSPEAPRSPARGAYLQTLEPSSRRWVLGGAKPPEEAALGPGTPGSGEPAGEIWYNPIPEEDPRTPAPEPLGSQPASPEPEGPNLQGRHRCHSPTPHKGTPAPPHTHTHTHTHHTPSSGSPPTKTSRAAPAGSVISRYHLDSSVGTPGRASVAGGARSPRAGYLSDGDSPERSTGPPSPTAFQPYEVGLAAPRGPPAALWGRLSLHLYGLGGLRPAPGATPRDLCCLLQVDGVAQARTGPLRAGPDFLRLDHTFHLELEAARLLRALVLAWDPGVRRHRPCAQGTVLLPSVFRGCQAQQLAVRLEPQGLLYAKLTLSERQEAPATPEPRVFGLPLHLLVDRERSPGQVPVIIRKCVGQIEHRGLRVVGLYRLCGSAAVKKELRDAFERDSSAVSLSEDAYPDINVITGILKDYLRELPTPLITQPLYQVVLEAMAQGHSGRASLGPEGTRGLLSCLPDVERVSRPWWEQRGRRTAVEPFNLAVCFGPVLLPARQALALARPRARGSGAGVSGAVDFKRHIEVLHYLLQSWPDTRRPPEPQNTTPHLRPEEQAPLAGPGVVTRPRGRRGPESPPSNRYAGDWSICGRDFLSGADYDHVTGSDRPGGSADFEDEFDAPFNPHLNLKDFDALILDLERELSKQINVCL